MRAACRALPVVAVLALATVRAAEPAPPGRISERLEAGLLAGRGDLVGAVEAARRAVRYQFQDWRHREQLWRLEQQLGDLDAAIEQARAAARYAPSWERERLPVVKRGFDLLYAAGIGMDCHHFGREGAPLIALSWESRPA